MLAVDTRDFVRAMARLGDEDVPAVARATVNTVAVEASKAMGPRMRRDLDRPTPFTLRAFRYGKASKGDPDPVATVYALPAQARYLAYAVDGGTRGRGAPGAYGDRFAVPVAARTDRFGGLSRTLLRRLSARRRAASKRTFYGTVSGVEGIWEVPGPARKRGARARPGRGRKRPGPRLLVRLATRTRHAPRLGFVDEMERAGRGMEATFAREWDRLIGEGTR